MQALVPGIDGRERSFVSPKSSRDETAYANVFIGSKMLQWKHFRNKTESYSEHEFIQELLKAQLISVDVKVELSNTRLAPFINAQHASIFLISSSVHSYCYLKPSCSPSITTSTDPPS